MENTKVNSHQQLILGNYYYIKSFKIENLTGKPPDLFFIIK
jgi:hypothetical protein